MTLTKYKDLQELFVNCIAYYPGQLNSDGKFVDVVGGYDGTVTGATRTGTDRFGLVNNSMVFNGSTNNIVPSSVISGAKSVFAWVYPIGGSASNYGVILRDNGGGYHLLIIDNSDRDLVFHVSEYIVWKNAITLNSWQFIGISLETINKGYVNGNSLGTPSSGTPNKTAFSGAINQIGRVNDATAFAGRIGEIFVFSSALTAGQVKTLYELTKLQYLYPLLSGGERGVY